LLDQALGTLDHHFGDLHVTDRGLVERRGDHFGAHAALHFRDFLGTLVDQQNDQVRIRMVVHDRLRDVLQHHRLAGLRLRDDESALAFADRRDQIEDAPGDVFGRSVAALEMKGLAREQRRQVFEQDLVLRHLRRFAVDVIDLEQRKVALAFFRRADAAGDVVAGTQIETTDLRGRHVDIVRAGEVRLVRTAQEAEAILQDFQNAFAVDAAAGACMRLQDQEDDVLLARAGDAFLDAERVGECEEVGC